MAEEVRPPPVGGQPWDTRCSRDAAPPPCPADWKAEGAEGPSTAAWRPHPSPAAATSPGPPSGSCQCCARPPVTPPTAGAPYPPSHADRDRQSAGGDPVTLLEWHPDTAGCWPSNSASFSSTSNLKMKQATETRVWAPPEAVLSPHHGPQPTS